MHFAHKTKWRPINFTINTPHFFSDSLCEQNKTTVQYFGIIIDCNQNVVKDLIQGINLQIQKHTCKQLLSKGGLLNGSTVIRFPL